MREVKVSIVTALIVLAFHYLPKLHRFYRYHGIKVPFNQLLFWFAKLLPSV
jgi:sphinganine-1-phosphate aldolase